MKNLLRSFDISNSHLIEAPPVTAVISGSIATNVEYTPDLADTTSDAFQEAAATTKADLETYFTAAESVISATVTVTGFVAASGSGRRRRRRSVAAEAVFEVELEIDQTSEAAASGDVSASVLTELRIVV